MSTLPVDFIAETFALDGELLAAEPFGRGNIHESFRLTCSRPKPGGYLLQRLNQQVFPDVERLMSNVRRLTEHLREDLITRTRVDPERHCLELIPTRDGAPYRVDERGEVFRVFRFIADSVSYQTIRGLEQAYLAANAFGCFHSSLSKLNPATFLPSLPDLHNTPKRFFDLRVTVTKDPVGRVVDSMPEIKFGLSRESLAGRLLSLMNTGVLPVRLVHNDAKLDNVLFDRGSGEVLCVCDLDTVMPGTSLYDFGDLVRSCAAEGGEDELDKAALEIRMDCFEALAEGYLDATRALLTDIEIRNLALAGQLITLETGIRFLTDYLQGDTYFKTNYREHNLVRCRAQFALVTSIERQLGAMKRIVSKLS